MEKGLSVATPAPEPQRPISVAVATICVAIELW